MIAPLHTPVVIAPKVVIDIAATYVGQVSITGVVSPVDVILFAVPDTVGSSG